jgi:hypothetical protein
LPLSPRPCGGNGSTSPTAFPSPSPTGVNRPPEITGASITPSAGGWRDLTTYTAHVDARDPDGERLTYAWTNYRGEPVEGVFSNGGADVSFTVQSFPGDFFKNVGPLTVTVNDPRGGSASSRIQFEARHFGNDRFLGRIGNVEYVWLYLNQTGGALSGT